MSGDVLLALTMVFSQAANPAATPHPSGPAPPAAPAIPGKTFAPPPESIRSFETDHAFADWSFQGWKISADGTTIKDFGRSEADTRQGLRLIRDLHLNQRGVIGGSTPSVEYWLSDGKPPQGPSSGLRVLPIDGASLRVDQTEGQWVLRDDRRVLFGFGQKEMDARQTLTVVQKYGFNEVGTVGAGTPSMMVFFAQTDPASAAPTAHPAAPTTGPAVDPASPAAKALAKHTGFDALQVPAVMPLRGAAFSSNGASPTADTSDRVPFDWRQVQLKKDNGAYKLAAGSFTLADFGGDEYAARLGLSAVSYYRFTEQHQAGGVTYYLSAGQAPRGLMFGTDGQAFEPDRLAVRPIDGRWAVCVGDVPLTPPSDSPEAANGLLAVIQQHHFDRLCRLGSADGKGMTFFVKSR